MAYIWFQFTLHDLQQVYAFLYYAKQIHVKSDLITLFREGHNMCYIYL